MNATLARSSSPITVLAFDFGTKRIGVAVGNTLTRAAAPLATLAGERADERFAAIGALVREWTPAVLVVGVPVHADGTPHAMTANAQRFARSLAGRHNLPVREVDERHTTELARAALASGALRGAGARATRDSVAAQMILQAWFDEHVTA